MATEQRCSDCGRLMIVRYRPTVLTSNPPLYPRYWWCGCGKEIDMEPKRGTTEEELARERWEIINAMEAVADAETE